MLCTPSADPRNDTASTSIVVVAPNALISTPPKGGPTDQQIQSVLSSLLVATTRWAGSTSALRCAPPAAANATNAVDWTTLTTYSCVMVSRPNAAAAGTLAKVANRTRSAVIIAGRLRPNSIHDPNGSASTALTPAPMAVSKDTCHAGAFSASTAIRPRAPAPTVLPAELMA